MARLIHRRTDSRVLPQWVTRGIKASPTTAKLCVVVLALNGAEIPGQDKAVKNGRGFYFIEFLQLPKRQGSIALSMHSFAGQGYPVEFQRIAG